MPLGIASLSLLLAIQAQTGDNFLAGLVSGLYVLGIGIAAPLVGRGIDRFGPRPLLRLSGLVYPAVMLLLAWSVGSGQAAWLWMALAVAGGMTLPQITANLRSAIPKLLAGRAEQQVAFTIDTLVIEAMFLIGPPLAGLFLAVGQPLGATLAAGVCGGAGALWFLRSPAVDTCGHNRWSTLLIVHIGFIKTKKYCAYKLLLWHVPLWQRHIFVSI